MANSNAERNGVFPVQHSDVMTERNARGDWEMNGWTNFFANVVRRDASGTSVTLCNTLSKRIIRMSSESSFVFSSNNLMYIWTFCSLERISLLRSLLRRVSSLRLVCVCVCVIVWLCDCVNLDICLRFEYDFEYIQINVRSFFEWVCSNECVGSLND